jgi:hypothetical protein
MPGGARRRRVRLISATCSRIEAQGHLLKLLALMTNASTGSTRGLRAAQRARTSATLCVERVCRGSTRGRAAFTEDDPRRHDRAA